MKEMQIIKVRVFFLDMILYLRGLKDKGTLRPDKYFWQSLMIQN